MKKIVSVLLLCAMLMSLVVVSSVSVSAEGETETPAAPRTGAYASIKPTIDGEIDEIWETAQEIALGSTTSYTKMLWDETGVYLLGVVKDANAYKIGFMIEEISIGCGVEWGWTDACYGVFLSCENELLTDNTVKTPKNGKYEYAVQKTDNGFVAEVFLSRQQGWMAVEFKPGNAIGFDVLVSAKDAGDGTTLMNTTNNGTWFVYWNTPDWLSRITLAENPGLPQVRNEPITMRGVQTTAVKDGTYDARFVSEIIGLEAECAGFEVSGFYGKDAEHQNEIPKQDLITTKAYISIMAGDKKVVPTADGNYLIALAVYGIPVSDEVVTVIFTVKPFTMNADGEKNYGEEATFTVVSGECR